jgi:hypothetical protein
MPLVVDRSRRTHLQASQATLLRDHGHSQRRCAHYRLPRLHRHLRRMDSHLGLHVAVGSRACSWCNLRHSTQSPWPFALPSLIVAVVVIGGLSHDINPFDPGVDSGRRSLFAQGVQRTRYSPIQTANATRKGLVEKHTYGGAAIQCALSVGSDSASLPRWFGS